MRYCERVKVNFSTFSDHRGEFHHAQSIRFDRITWFFGAMNALSNSRGLREKLLDSLDREEWEDLFMHGGCGIWAMLLHEKLNLPLAYFCFPDVDQHSHVVAVRGDECFDFEGKKSVAAVAENFAGWPDERPRPTTSEEVRARLAAHNCSDLEAPMMEIARNLFEARRQLYE
jgi:hypothetical protein